MHLIIIGGGWITRNVAKMLSTTVDKITIIEKDLQVCDKVSKILAAYIFNADGTDIETLKVAGIDKADGLVVLTRDDNTNLKVCTLAKQDFQIPYVLSLVNHMENVEKFEQLGVNIVETPPIILSSLQDKLKLFSKQLIYLDEQRNIMIAKLIVTEDSQLIGKSHETLQKMGVIPLMIYRDGMRSFFSDDIILQANDIIFIGGDRKKIDNFLYTL